MGWMGSLWWLFTRPVEFLPILTAVSLISYFHFYDSISPSLYFSIDWFFFIHSLNMSLSLMSLSIIKVLSGTKHLLYWQYPSTIPFACLSKQFYRYHFPSMTRFSCHKAWHFWHKLNITLFLSSKLGGAPTLSVLLKLLSRKYEPWFLFHKVSFYLSTNLAKNAVAMFGLVCLAAT